MITSEGEYPFLPPSLPLGEGGRIPLNSPPEGQTNMSENLDLIERLEKMSAYVGPKNVICGFDWHLTLQEAKAEIERLRKYEDTIKMACRW